MVYNILDKAGLKTLLGKIKTYIANATVKRATTADKLTTARKISLTGAASSYGTFDGSSNINIQVSANSLADGALMWKNDFGNRAGQLSPIAVAASSVHCANRFAYINPNNVIVEYSNDDGETWTEWDNDLYKRKLTTNFDSEFSIGGPDIEKAVPESRLRVTFIKQDIYCNIRKMLIRITTTGATGSMLDIEGFNNTTNEYEFLLKDQVIGGWSGWNEINKYFTFGSSKGQYGKLRFTFHIKGVSENYNSKLKFMGLYVIGDNMWTKPSEMANSNHLYAYDEYQNATFPKRVHANNLFEIDNSNVLGIYRSGKTIDTVVLSGGDVNGAGTATFPTDV